MKLLIFTYAPAGLGHLRVTDALMDSRPKEHPYLLLGSYDRFITRLHRFTSTNRVAKWIFTVSQYGFLEDIVTAIYRFLLTVTSRQIYWQLKDIILRNGGIDEILVIATHFGLAHQIGAVKRRLMDETGVSIRLVVQVTDDTSQHIWCVRGADLTFVPSSETRIMLNRYAEKMKMGLKFSVIPYPLSPSLVKPVSKSSEKRVESFLSIDKPINIAIPISGAAVGLKYTQTLIRAVLERSKRFRFWVVSRKAKYTERFTAAISRLENVHLITGKDDNEMINAYEQMYTDNLVHLEITKPSEQAFKALIHPGCVGGSILLFTQPVGRQEYDNVEFLTRKNLLPDGTKKVPRALRLPSDPVAAADFIIWGLNSGVFLAMSSEKYEFPKDAVFSGEVSPNGSKMFWKIVDKEFS